MAKKTFADWIKQEGVEAWNQWRWQHPESHPDLRSVNLIGAELSGADLIFAHLSRAKMRLSPDQRASMMPGE